MRIQFLRTCVTAGLVAAALPLAAEDPTNGQSLSLFLLAGQSNMAGRGVVTDADREPVPGIWALAKDGEWKPAVDPLHFDKPIAGVGLGRAFAAEIQGGDPELQIGLIPAAVGGSPISTWVPGGYHAPTKIHPYDAALERARKALEAGGSLRAILWHQGESDCKPEASAIYQDRLTELIARFRDALSLPELPFIIGQLGRFEGREWSEDTERVDAAHRAVAEADPHVAFVSSEGLKAKSDGVHFDAASLQEFGRRYAAAYQTLVGQGPDDR